MLYIVIYCVMHSPRKKKKIGISYHCFFLNEKKMVIKSTMGLARGKDWGDLKCYLGAELRKRKSGWRG